MSIISDPAKVRDIYRIAGEKGWVLPCFCTENLTTTEAILSAAEDYRRSVKLSVLPVIIAITCRYDHRSQAVNYTHTRRWNVGLRLFMADLRVLAQETDVFEHLQVMIHLDHIQHDLDDELLGSDLSPYSSIMYDASSLPLDMNIRKTSEFVKQWGDGIVIEGACDEIVDAEGTQKNALTTPERAQRYFNATGADMIVANLGTEHRASGQELQYHGDIARAIQDRIGPHIVLHGTSSVRNDQIRDLYSDGICKVNIWTALERESSPVLFEHMVHKASQVAGTACVNRLIDENYLTQQLRSNDSMSIDQYTTLTRQSIVFEKMKSLVLAYLDMWYQIKD